MIVELHKGEDQQWRWRIRDVAGDIIASSAKGQRRRGDAKAAWDKLAAAAMTFRVVEAL